MTVEEATANLPKEVGIARYGEPEEIAELVALLVSPCTRWDDLIDASHGRRRGEIYLTKIGNGRLVSFIHRPLSPELNGANSCLSLNTMTS
jgi:hypothetical protein